MKIDKDNPCPKCGGKKRHQNHCEYPSREEKLKIAAGAIHDAADYWLGLLEQEYNNGPVADNAYSLIQEFYYRSTSGYRPSTILRPAQM